MRLVTSLGVLHGLDNMRVEVCLVSSLVGQSQEFL